MMIQKLEFIVIVKLNNLLEEPQVKSIFQSRGLTETTLSKGQIKVWFFQGSYSDFNSTKSWLESEEISQYLNLIEIGLAPDFEIETSAEPELFIEKNYQAFLQNLTKKFNS
ncbi:hypothetical protein H1P_400010 [Hyella patelloides LEGE 07179]|uniref:Uncharacterized protein n=1 Tax=Hyella patelloides LEGE 07179 TaxID=945734 RepID=A0A563VX68_9CYAN|nr:hypothetical protein [Hyella patelloides]VEP16054.1 hypothetical protein H1P_400010 [Hyella patelloides LEGE 07179]